MTSSWVNTSPCACSVSANGDASNIWSADFISGYQEVDRVEYLGRYPGWTDQGDGIVIEVETASGWVSCGTTSNSASG